MTNGTVVHGGVVHDTYVTLSTVSNGTMVQWYSDTLLHGGN